MRFLHGCFWHGCRRCYRELSGNQAYWSTELLSNRRRDRRVAEQPRAPGWTVLTFWECDLVLTKTEKVLVKLARALNVITDFTALTVAEASTHPEPCQRLYRQLRCPGDLRFLR